LRSKTSFRRLRSTRAGEPGGTVLTLASDPSNRAPSLQSAARIGSCTVAFLRRGVPLPTHSGSHSLAGRLVLPSVRPAALMGFASLRSVAPHRVGRHFCRPGPTCRSRRAPAPINFRRGDPIVRSESLRNRRWTKRTWGDWRSTSGLHSRLRAALAVIVAAGRDPAMGFASCRVAGTRLCIRAGSSP